MPTKYVNSAATGAKDGTSWTDAWTSIGAALNPAGYSESGTALADDDVCLVHYAHSKVYNANTALVFPSNTRFISVDKDNSDAYTTGASEDSGSTYYLNLNGGDRHTVRFEGLSFYFHDASVDYWCGGGYSGQQMTFKDCTFDLSGNTYFNGYVRYIMEDCTIDCNSASMLAVFTIIDNAPELVLKNVSFSNVAASTELIQSDIDGPLVTVEIEGCDLSAFSALYESGTVRGPVRINAARCKLPSSLVSSTTSMCPGINITTCYSDTTTLSAAPHGLFDVRQLAGAITKDTTYKLSSGAANDGTRDFSYKMTPVTTYCNMTDPLESPPLRTWHDASGSKTLTVYVCSDTAHDANEIWMEAAYNDASTSPVGDFATTKPDYGASATLSTTSSLWAGSPTNQYKLELTVNPNFAGEVEVRVFVGRSGTAPVYVHPIPELL